MDKVNIGSIEPFSNEFMSDYGDKGLALKPLEEAAEVFGAWQSLNNEAKSGANRDEWIVDGIRKELEDEIADTIQACVNLAAYIKLDLHDAIIRCHERNDERGRYSDNPNRHNEDDECCDNSDVWSVRYEYDPETYGVGTPDGIVDGLKYILETDDIDWAALSRVIIGHNATRKETIEKLISILDDAAKKVKDGCASEATCHLDVYDDLAGGNVICCSECGYTIGGTYSDYQTARKVMDWIQFAHTYDFCPNCGSKVVD